MKEQIYLGVDLGAESGRVMAGAWDGRKLRIEELHRFSNGPVNLGESLRWDVLRLWTEIQNGLALAAQRFGDSIVSVGVDTWGVDFALLTRNGEMLGQAWHYRDARTSGIFREAFARVPRREIFARTGLQFMEINTLYQLLVLQRDQPDLLAAADCLLMMPDFFHWCLCGARVAEFTNASTTQCLDPVTRDWSGELLERFGLPRGIFPKTVQPGANLGWVRDSVCRKTGLGRVQVIAPPTHDTASAVAGTPTSNTGRTDWAYLSSGTWSLMGVESQNALLSDRVLELNLTNEGGIDGTYRVLKNITGLWLVQRCKQAFAARGGTSDYAELTLLAEKAPKGRSRIEVEDARFANPSDMPAAIQQFCRETKQPVPESEGDLVRCALESLAARYGVVFQGLEEVTGNRIEVIHLVGGGSRNHLLNQLTADACQRPVIAGPVETTALGNLLMQIRAHGELKSLAEMRAIVRASSELRRFEPQGF
ncbi:MAG TPA: rhamnulokinase family protein [Candidatus Saccharimonadales bacterium]|nr:rhamnulokinase family protein [Candidatus Saccharimonadales bacterium]